MLLTVVLFILILSLLVFVHEFGHFSSARRLGVGVEEFGFGFPPRIFGIKRGGTIYSINAIPFGGFVRLKGEQELITDSIDSFSAQPAWKRVIILASGVTMNVLLAIGLSCVVFLIGAPAVVDSGALPSGAIITQQRVQIVNVLEGSPAEKSGLKAGDVIDKIDGVNITLVDNVQASTNTDVASAHIITIVRGDLTRDYSVLPEKLAGSTQPKFGVSLAQTGLVHYRWYDALWRGAWNALSLLGQIFVSLYDLLRNLIVHGSMSADVAGPIGIAVVTGQVAQLGFVYILQFIIVLSLSLAAMNILPIPALDGGRILFIVIEKIRRRPVSHRVEAIVHTVGFYALIALIIAISYRDIINFDVGQRIRDLFRSIVS